MDERARGPTAVASGQSANPACIACGRVADWEARYCSACGHPIEAYGPIEANDPPRVEAEALPLVGVSDPLIGCVVAERYRILDVVGRGAMGVVYLVEHAHIGKLMAMKLLRGDVAHREEVAERFSREARAASMLKHPSTVQVFDFGQSEGLSYLVMEYVEGEDIGRLLDREGPIAFDRLARLVHQVCGSLAEAHFAGIVHRDIKPTNLLITADPEGGERLKIADFGLAQLRPVPTAKKVTAEGAIVGTPYYISPEQIQWSEVDGRADIYSLGVVMYRGCVGELPFLGPGSIAVLAQHLQQAPPAPSSVRAELPPEADRIILKCLQKDPAARYTSVIDLRHELERYLGSLAHRPQPARALRSGRPPSARSLPNATRRDIVGFEQKRRRRAMATTFGRIAFAMGLLGALIGAGLFVFPRVQASGFYSNVPTEVVDGRERERNDSAAEAQPLEPGTPVRGQLGKPFDSKLGDVDFYRIAVPSAASCQISVELSGVPNLNLMLELYPGIASRPLITVDAAPAGGPERLVTTVPGVGSHYYLAVRQRVEPGATPTLNRSDDYVLAVDLVPADSVKGGRVPPAATEQRR